MPKLLIHIVPRARKGWSLGEKINLGDGANPEIVLVAGAVLEPEGIASVSDMRRTGGFDGLSELGFLIAGSERSDSRSAATLPRLCQAMGFPAYADLYAHAKGIAHAAGKKTPRGRVKAELLVLAEAA